MKKLTVGSCFSGIGGLELGLEWTGGFETKWQIEIDPYATKVLEKHWPNVKRYSDIRDVGQYPVDWTRQCRSAVSFPVEAVDVICGGFPCQDVSLAGARAGLDGKRSTLWGELFRLVCEVGPRWLVAENVPGLLSSDGGRFMGNILRDLASIGFDAEWGLLSAFGVGAPQFRRRLFVVAYAKSEQNRRLQSGRFQSNIGASGAVADADGTRLSERIGETLGERGEQESQRFRGTGREWWAIEPSVGRVAHGVSSRVDRLRCLGNAVVPQVAQKIGEMILEYEREMNP